MDVGHVCASNGRTYERQREVRCLKKTNASLAILHEGACSVQEVQDIVGLDDVCTVATQTNLEIPICGSNNVTYTDAFAFLCASKSSPDNNSKCLSYIFQFIF
jgi:Kazal-type serine protease inhibitor domain